MRHSYSALKTLAECERKYALRFIEELEADRKDRPAPLRGTAWHGVTQAHLLGVGAHKGTLLVQPPTIQMLKGIDLPINWADPYCPTIAGPDFGPELPLDALSMLAHVTSWFEHQETDYQEELVADHGGPLPERLRDLYFRYCDHYADDDQRYEPLVTEYEWSRQAPNGKQLQGRVDAVLFDTQLGLVTVRDYKTHASWPSEPDAVLDLMDSQLHLQAWGVAPLLKEHGLLPQAVQFDRLRFKKPTEPKLTAKGLLSASITDFDSYTYKRWCIDNEIEPDEAVVAKCDAKTDAWFRRSGKPLSMRSVEAHVKSLQVQAVRADALDPDTAILVPSKDCSWCDFLSLCRAEIIGGRPTPFVPQDYSLRKIKS